jgi:hypothetical protein
MEAHSPPQEPQDAPAYLVAPVTPSGLLRMRPEAPGGGTL